MCILAIAWKAHPHWQLIAAGNRDERHDRPAAALARWPEWPHVMAGRDLQSGGSWLGVSEEGRFAVVTNVRNPAGPNPRLASRGALVTDFLAGAGRSADPDGVAPEGFNPFNLVAISRGRARFLSNRPEPLRRDLEPGVHGLANGLLDEPWAKTLQIKAALRHWLEADGADPRALLAHLARETPAAPPMPDGVRPEPALTPVFIRDPVYGTRCSTVVAVDGAGKGLIVERRFTAAGDNAGETALTFAWPAG